MLEKILDLRGAGIYQQDNKILDNVSFNLTNAEICYLVGKTGSGKSSLLRTIYGDLKLKEGEGHVVGFDLHALKEKDIPYLRRKMGMVFQDFHLMMDQNVGTNLSFVLRATGWKNQDKIRSRVLEVLDEVGMDELVQRMPYELSGGEQQRVVIARALLNEPQLIIADEPTGNLDPETSDEILHLLRSLAIDKGVAILLATHDYRLIEKFPARILRCTDGLVENAS